MRLDRPVPRVGGGRAGGQEAGGGEAGADEGDARLMNCLRVWA